MRFIILNEDNKVIGVRFGESVVEGEIESNVGEIGQILQEDGTFIKPDTIDDMVENELSMEEIQIQTLLNTEFLVVMSELNNL